MSASTLLNKRMAAAALSAIALVALAMVVSSRSDATEVPATSETFSVLEASNADGVGSLPDAVKEWVDSLPEFGGPTTPLDEVGVADTASGDEVVVVAGGPSICFYNLDGGMSNCANAALAAAGQIYTASPDLSASADGCAGWSVTGVMPDGVDSLAVDAQGVRGPAIIPVTSNVYTATLAPVRTTLSSGAISVELPLDEFAAGNTAC